MWRSSSSVTPEIVEIIDPALLQGRHQTAGERVHVNLQTYREAGLRTYAATHAAELGALDALKWPQRTAPEALVVERVEAEQLFAFRQSLSGMFIDLLIEFSDWLLVIVQHGVPVGG